MKDTVNKKTWTTNSVKKAQSKMVSAPLNKLLWTIVFLVAAAVVFSSMYFPIFIASKPLMTAFIIVGIVALLVIARFTNQGMKGWNFLLDARLEMRKVVWPTRQETINSTIIVLVIVVIASLLIYFVGLLFMHLIQWILN